MAMDPSCVAVEVVGHSWPFSLKWWLSLTAADQGAWVAGLGAFVAALVAVGISYMQFRRDAIHERRIAMAIAPALAGDLNLALHALEQIKEDAFKIQSFRIAHHEEIERALRAIGRIRLTAFERFKEMLPMLGNTCAPIVIECYATILRTVELVRDELETTPETQALKEGLIAIAKNVDNLISRVKAAQRELMPQVQLLSASGTVKAA